MNIYELFKQKFGTVDKNKLRKLIFSYGEERLFNLLSKLEHPEFIKQPYVWLANKGMNKSYQPSWKKQHHRK